MKSKLFIIALFTVTALKSAPPADEGKNIFSARCASCHSVNKVLVGPALAGLDKRRSVDWIINFVHSSQTMVKSGDKTAVELFNQFNQIQMPDHPDLTNDNIKSVVAYIKSQSAVAIEKAPFPKPVKIAAHYKPLSLKDDYGFFIGYLAIVVLLILGLLFAVQVKMFERNMRNNNS